MGVWGHEPFANDAAADWAHDLTAYDDLALVEGTLDAALSDADEYVDLDLGCEALAACEVVARLRGNWGRRDAYSEPADRWVEEHPLTVPSRVLRRAIKTLDRLLGDASELRELWDEGTAGDDWRAVVLDLRRRVEAE
jgi:hypothetical protein